MAEPSGAAPSDATRRLIVAAHQPHYLPWLGYLDKIARADVFVVMDDLQFEAQNFQNRQRLKLATGPRWLTVPLVHAPLDARIRDRRIDDSGRGGRHHWQHRHWRTLEMHYGRAPGFAQLAPALGDVYAHAWTHLLDLNLHLLDLAMDWFGITTPVVRASTLRPTGARTERIRSVCEALGATHYLSGRGGSLDYLDTGMLAQAGIEVIWHDYQHPVYPQRYPGLGFVPRLGFLDFLFNRERSEEWRRAQAA